MKLTFCSIFFVGFATFVDDATGKKRSKEVFSQEIFLWHILRFSYCCVKSRTCRRGNKTTERKSQQRGEGETLLLLHTNHQRAISPRAISQSTIFLHLFFIPQVFFTMQIGSRIHPPQIYININEWPLSSQSNGNNVVTRVELGSKWRITCLRDHFHESNQPRRQYFTPWNWSTKYRYVYSW